MDIPTSTPLSSITTSSAGFVSSGHQITISSIPFFSLTSMLAVSSTVSVTSNATVTSTITSQRQNSQPQPQLPVLSFNPQAPPRTHSPLSSPVQISGHPPDLHMPPPVVTCTYICLALHRHCLFHLLLLLHLHQHCSSPLPLFLFGEHLNKHQHWITSLRIPHQVSFLKIGNAMGHFLIQQKLNSPATPLASNVNFTLHSTP